MAITSRSCRNQISKCPKDNRQIILVFQFNTVGVERPSSFYANLILDTISERRLIHSIIGKIQLLKEFSYNIGLPRCNMKE